MASQLTEVKKVKTKSLVKTDLDFKENDILRKKKQ